MTNGKINHGTIIGKTPLRMRKIQVRTLDTVFRPITSDNFVSMVQEKIQDHVCDALNQNWDAEGKKEMWEELMENVTEDLIGYLSWKDDQDDDEATSLIGEFEMFCEAYRDAKFSEISRMVEND